MKRRAYLPILIGALLVLTAIALAACGETPTASPTDPPTAPPTEAPTATEAPTEPPDESGAAA
ncbi:MAG: carbohydrate ABC transporter substrate-binding protein, partial [Chloroflexi bacterium]|nr:carbohydrate ABC transporter substrate-binding protein [Chloroflexota bacterium]